MKVSQISNQLTAAWQCGRIWGMCWSHVAHAPDLTARPPQPAQQPSCLKGLFNIQKMRASAFCADTQSQDQTEPVITLSMKWKPINKNYITMAHLRLQYSFTLDHSQHQRGTTTTLFQQSVAFRFLSSSDGKYVWKTSHRSWEESSVLRDYTPCYHHRKLGTP